MKEVIWFLPDGCSDMLQISYDLLDRLSSFSKEIYLVYDLKQNQLLFMSNLLSYFPSTSLEDIKNEPSLILTLLHPEDKDFVIKHLNRIKEDKNVVVERFRLYLPDKSIRWVNLKAYRLDQESQQNLVFLTIEDITQRKEYEKSLYNIKEQKDIVLQIIGHDLRSPLSIIQLSSTLLKRETKEMKESEMVHKLIETIDSTVKSTLEMINDLLDVEYLETQEMKFIKTRVNIVNRIQNLIDAFHLKKTQKKIDLSASKEEIYVAIDPVKFMLIMENIVSNAYKFTGSDGIIKINVQEKADNILITIADNGIGIPEKFQPIVFDKFTMARRKGMQGEKPVGLGMYIIKKMTEMHNGRIWFESKEGEGTVFYVEIPKAGD